MSNDLSHAVWRKSSRSGDQGQCVEVTQNLADAAALRDSKNPHQAALTVTKGAFAGFLSSVKSGKYDL